MTTPAAPQERATLSRELGEFLIELSIALHKHAMYPEGHPSLAPAVAAVGRRAGDLLRDRASLSLGVAHRQLVIEGVATDPKHPVLAELAGRLHRHHLGAVTFHRGITGDEFRAGLRTLAEEADRSAQPLGLRPRDTLPQWEHLRLHPLTYDRLELLDEGGEGSPSESRGARARSAQLWVGLARAALAGQFSDDQVPDTTPAVVAQAIDAHPRGEAYDQVIVGYLLQIAEDLKGTGGREGADLRRRTSRLIGGLKPETLRRLIEMGGDRAQRRKFVLDATHGMAVDAVLELLRAAADTSRQTISHSLIRMLSKLAVHAEQGTAQARPLADSALREQVEQLLAGWELDDPNPGDYGAALQQMARAKPVFAAPVEPAYASEDDRMVEMSVEVDTPGPLVWKAVDRLSAGPRFLQLIELLDAAPPGRAVVAEIRARVVTPAALAAALAATPVSFQLIDRLIAGLGAAAADPLLDALAAAESRSLRRGLLDRLGKIGPPLGNAILPRLGDERWYVVRNLLVLLEELPALPAGFAAATFRAHADARVRRQALRIQLRGGTDRDATLVGALEDPDGATRHLALVALQHDCPVIAVPTAARLARDPTLATEDRVLAIRALGRAGGPHALAGVLALTEGGRTLFGRPRLPSKSPELLAALAALTAGWRRDRAAAAVLARAATSPDADVRAATLVARSDT